MSNYNSQLQSNNADLQTVLQSLQTKAAGSGSSKTFVVQDTPPEDTSVLWVDPTDNTADVPEAFGGGIAVTGAAVGQTVKIAEVDENGAPTAWEAVDFPGGKSVTKYVNPAEIPLENGAQYIFYAAEGCTITIEIGTFNALNGGNKAEFQLATRNSVIWFLWTQTDVDGSLIPTHGDRGYYIFEGDCSKMKVSATTQYNYVVLKVS